MMLPNPYAPFLLLIKAGKLSVLGEHRKICKDSQFTLEDLSLGKQLYPDTNMPIFAWRRKVWETTVKIYHLVETPFSFHVPLNKMPRAVPSREMSKGKLHFLLS